MHCLRCKRFWCLLVKGAFLLGGAFVLALFLAYGISVKSVDFFDDDPLSLTIRRPALTLQRWELIYVYPDQAMAFHEMFYMIAREQYSLRKAGLLPEDLGPEIHMDYYTP